MKLKLFKRDSNPAAVASKNDSLLNTSNWAMVDKNPYEIHDDRPSAQQELLSRKDESDVDVYSKLDDIGVGHSRSGTSKSAATGLDEESFGSSGSGGVERAEFVDNTADSSDQSAAMSVTNPNPFSSKVFPLIAMYILTWNDLLLSSNLELYLIFLPRSNRFL